MLFPDCGANVRRKTGRHWPGFLLRGYLGEMLGPFGTLQVSIF